MDNQSKISNIRDSLSNSVKNFSSNMYNVSKDFLNTNSLVAKFVFIILVLIVFLIFLNLGIIFLAYIFQPPQSPYLIKGMLNGTNTMIIPQDPKKGNSISLLRSNNQSSGMEFTWSVWLNISNVSSDKYHHVFSKGGNGIFDDKGIMLLNNAPGLYIKPATQSSTITGVPANLVIFMNTASAAPDMADYSSIYETIEIDNVPMNSWVNIMLRLENKIMDIYVNGTITQRLVFSDVPMQNYDDVYVCANGGFAGFLSNLRYFNYALNVFQINRIVSDGPSKTLMQTYNNSKDYYYLSNLWYNSNSNMY